MHFELINLMKSLVPFIVLIISINCFGETNRQILEDIRDEVEFMQYQQELRDVDRLNRAKQNAQDIQTERERWERENRAINEMLAKQKLELDAAGRMEAERYSMSIAS